MLAIDGAGKYVPGGASADGGKAEISKPVLVDSKKVKYQRRGADYVKCR